jgi:hypothetical protein
MSAILTKHSIARANERLALRSGSLQRLADAALQDGIKHADTSGSLKRYLDRLFFTERTGDNNRIYGSHVFIFSGATLITVHLLPHKFSQAVAKIRTRKHGGGK